MYVKLYTGSSMHDTTGKHPAFCSVDPLVPKSHFSNEFLRVCGTSATCTVTMPFLRVFHMYRSRPITFAKHSVFAQTKA